MYPKFEFIYILLWSHNVEGQKNITKFLLPCFLSAPNKFQASTTFRVAAVSLRLGDSKQEEIKTLLDPAQLHTTSSDIFSYICFYFSKMTIENEENYFRLFSHSLIHPFIYL